MKQIHFFALRDDLLSVLEAVERDGSLRYVQMGQFPTSNYESYGHGAEIPNLGRANTDSSASCESFLVTDSMVSINVRPIQTVAGIQRFGVDQLINPDTVTFTPAGVWDDDIVLNGRVATVSDSALAVALMKRFNSAFRKHFKKVRAFMVGPGALVLLDAGKRLTASAQSPREYDLTTVTGSASNPK